jgi:hypothetical protein
MFSTNVLHACLPSGLWRQCLRQTRGSQVYSSGSFRSCANNPFWSAKLATANHSSLRRLSTTSDNKWIEIAALANLKLAQYGIVVKESTLPLSPKLVKCGYRLLEICSNGSEKPIDIFNSSSQTAEDLVRKSKQHIEAEKTSGILISPLGRKVDVRKVSSLTMGKDGSIFFNDWKVRPNFLGCVQENDKIPFSSCTIIRAVEGKDGEIEFFDEADADPGAKSPTATLNPRGAILSLSYPSDNRRAFFKRFLANTVP